MRPCVSVAVPVSVVGIGSNAPAVLAIVIARTVRPGRRGRIAKFGIPEDAGSDASSGRWSIYYSDVAISTLDRASQRQHSSLAADRVVGVTVEDLLKRHLAVQLAIERHEHGPESAQSVGLQHAETQGRGWVGVRRGGGGVGGEGGGRRLVFRGPAGIAATRVLPHA